MHPKIKILIIDDDPVMGDVVKDILSYEGYAVSWVGNGGDALETVLNENVEAVLLDLLLPGINGMEILRQILEHRPSTVVIMMSGHGSIKDAVQATKLGAYDWLEKPLEKERLLLTVRHAIEKNRLGREKDVLLRDVKERYRMIGASPAMKQVFHLIDRVAAKDATVMITGESGTGKELVAHAIHHNSPRAAAPFVRMNCAAVPETLIESELFGHVRGAFTNALFEKKGKFQAADGGTLFMDEIGDLSLSAQSKVLRAVETGEVAKVGSEKLEETDIRLISATNKDLSAMAAADSFRKDLFHRINVIEIRIPPLRDRKEDILPIAEHFLDEYSGQYNIQRKQLTADAESMLLMREWKGNVRELRNMMEKLVVLVDGPRIGGQEVALVLDEACLTPAFQQAKTYKQTKEQFEKSYLLRMLKTSGWNIQKTAEAIDMPRSLLYRKMEKYGIRPEVEKGEG
jgi:two-component system, NtrC family, nitrogen regulation response regulator NtrX